MVVSAMVLRAASQLKASANPVARLGAAPLANTAVRAFSTADPVPEKPPVEEPKGFLLGPWLIGVGAAAGVGTLAAYQLGYFDSPSSVSLPDIKPVEVKKDYNDVKRAIADILEDPDYDDGSYGPVLVRLAWHVSGTYSKHDGTGGSNGCTQRFSPEADWGANAGLDVARNLLEPIKAKFPWVSYADLYTLAGAVAIEEMGGPQVPWRPGRTDAPDSSNGPPDGRLPDGDKGASHVRDIFYRMGFNDQEIVALVGAHTLGRCHADRSGYINPWTNAPTTFSNLYFTELKNNRWSKKRWNGPLQYEDKSKQLMMLPADMALIWDRGFRKYVDLYAKDEEAFFKDFAVAFGKLLELGAPLEGAYL